MIGSVFLDEAQIAARVGELAAQLSRDYRERNPLFVGILKSSSFFLADLVRAMTIPVQFDLLALSSYARERERSARRNIRLEKDLAQPVEGRHVVIVEDVVDTGLTLHYVLRTLGARAPASLAVCALLDRPHRRIADVQIAYRGFTIPDVILVGYGMDEGERHRELPELHVLESA